MTTTSDIIGLGLVVVLSANGRSEYRAVAAKSEAFKEFLRDLRPYRVGRGETVRDAMEDLHSSIVCGGPL